MLQEQQAPGGQKYISDAGANMTKVAILNIILKIYS